MILVYLLAAIGLIGLAWRLAQVGRRDRPDRGRPDATAETVESLLAAGNTIGAIKRLREQTGLGLKESKEAVERLGSGH